MNTVVTRTCSNLELSITRFAASKRGWSTWLVAAADTHVDAFVQMVMNMPNLHPKLHHMWHAVKCLYNFCFCYYYYYELI